MSNTSKDFIIAELKKGRLVTKIAQDVGISRTSLYGKFKKWGIRPQLLKFNHDFFETIDTEAKAYWLGFLYADGCIADTMGSTLRLDLGLHERDKNHVEKLHQALDSCINIRKYGKVVRSSHYSVKLCSDLIKLGCTPRKSLTLTFPEIDKTLIHHFVRGYFDGDGHVGWKNNATQLRITIIGTENFLDALQRLWGTHVKLQKPSRAFSLDLSGNLQCKRIFDWMYSGATIYLERKRRIFDGPNV